MKTIHKAARLSHLDVNKIARYFEKPTIREFIEATIKASEENEYLKNKIKEQIKQGRVK